MLSSSTAIHWMIRFSVLTLHLPSFKGSAGMLYKQLTSIFLLTITCLVEAGQPTKSANQPNFIIIYTDDMGYADAGPFGDPLINTPSIDSLADDGQVWTNFYAAASVCTPSRGALLTGKLPVRTGLYGDNISVFFPGSKSGIPHSEKTIAEVFQDNRYATGMFGKWHLGDAKTYYPTRHGFDEWLGIPYSNDMDWEIEGITSKNIFTPPEQIAAKYQKIAPKIRENIFEPDISDWQVPLISSKTNFDGTFTDLILEKPANQNLITRRYTEESVRFMTEASSKNKPFFLMLSHSMPHVPLFRSSAFANKSERGLYGDVIEEIDWSVGQIMAAIEKLNIAQNTYLVFTSDNGPWLLYGSHAGSAKPLKNGKSTTFEGGMRVMTLFSGPGIQQGVIEGLGMQTDLYATFSQLAGFKASKTALDSFDLSATLTREESSPRTFVPFYSGSELRAFRVNRHKIHYVTQGAYGMLPKRKEHNPPMLIDLKNDIGETTDISGKEPVITANIDQYAKVFQQSITIKSSIVDSQFSQ